VLKILVLKNTEICVTKNLVLKILVLKNNPAKGTYGPYVEA